MGDRTKPCSKRSPPSLGCDPRTNSRRTAQTTRRAARRNRPTSGSSAGRPRPIRGNRLAEKERAERKFEERVAAEAPRAAEELQAEEPGAARQGGRKG